jgi:hypothetical protein
VEKFAVNSESTSRQIEWGPLLLGAVGAILFLLGAGRFVLAHRFSLSDALLCCALLIPAWLLLLVISYVVQHAIFVSIIPIAATAMWAYSSPTFDVALGLALIALLAESAMSDKHANEAWRKYNEEAAAEKRSQEPPEMPPDERETKLRLLATCKSAGEKAYDEMYEAHSSSHATACYSEAKESFYSAIALARELGLAQEIEDLEKRLTHIKSVFRSQFS